MRGAQMASLKALALFWNFRNAEGIELLGKWYDPDPKNPVNLV
jgi:hypothetical protein